MFHLEMSLELLVERIPISLPHAVQMKIAGVNIQKNQLLYLLL